MREKKIVENVVESLMGRRIMADDDHDETLANIDQALDTMIACIQSIEENLPGVQTDNVPQKAALDTFQEILDEAIKPYLADVIKAMSVFEV